MRIRIMQRAVALAIVMMVLTIGSVAAHAGHSHADEGLDVMVTLQVAGTVLVLGAATLLANRYFRSHEQTGRRSRLNRNREE